jgi:hypothetical protein
MNDRGSTNQAISDASQGTDRPALGLPRCAVVQQHAIAASDVRIHGPVMALALAPLLDAGKTLMTSKCVARIGLVPDIKDLEPLIGRWSQVVDAPRHLEEKVRGDMTLEWLRDEKVILQRSIADNPMFPEGVVLIMAADEDAEGDFTAHYFDSRAVSRVLHMSFQDSVWKWWRRATDPDDFDQRFEGTLSEDGKTIDSSCYLIEAGEWIHDFDVTYTRA